MKTIIVTNQVMALARQHHWWFRILGVEKPIVDPIYKNGWWFIPKEQDKTIIPSKAIRRLEELRKAGVPITQVIVAHEAPKVLPSPNIQPVPIQIPWKKLAKGFTVSVSAVANAMVIVVSAMASVFITMLPYLFLLPLVMIDPALIIQLPDGTLVEVYSWLD